MPDESSESKEHCFLVRVCVQMRGMEPHPQQNNLGIPGPPVPGVPLDRRPKLIEGTVYHIFSCNANVCMVCWCAWDVGVHGVLMRMGAGVCAWGAGAHGCWCAWGVCVLCMASLLTPCSGAGGSSLMPCSGQGEQF